MFDQQKVFATQVQRRQPDTLSKPATQKLDKATKKTTGGGQHENATEVDNVRKSSLNDPSALGKVGKG